MVFKTGQPSDGLSVCHTAYSPVPFTSANFMVKTRNVHFYGYFILYTIDCVELSSSTYSQVIHHLSEIFLGFYF